MICFIDNLTDIYDGTTALDGTTNGKSVLELIWLLSCHITSSFISGIVSEFPAFIIFCDTNVALMMVLAHEVTQEDNLLRN